MHPADEVAAKKEPTENQSAGTVAGSDDSEQLRVSLEELLGPSPQRKPVKELDDYLSEISHRLDQDASERKAIYSRLAAIENEKKRPASRGFARFLLAICIGAAAILAWQSYGEAAKQIIATSAPELGWSPEAKQMIASWVPVGWTKSVPEAPQAAPVMQTAPAVPSIDPEKIQQMTQSLVALRQTVEQLAAGQDQMTRVISRLETAVAELIVKTPEPPPQPPPAPARKPMPVPQSSRAPVVPPTSRGIPPPHP